VVHLGKRQVYRAAHKWMTMQDEIITCRALFCGCFCAAPNKENACIYASIFCGGLTNGKEAGLA
jgi:hypothetical protein